METRKKQSDNLRPQALADPEPSSGVSRAFKRLSTTFKRAFPQPSSSRHILFAASDSSDVSQPSELSGVYTDKSVPEPFVDVEVGDMSDKQFGFEPSAAIRANPSPIVDCTACLNHVQLLCKEAAKFASTLLLEKSCRVLWSKRK